MLETGLTTTKRILKRLVNVEDENKVDMKGTTLACDRGYECDEMQRDYAPAINLETVPTVKRGANMPFKFGHTSYKSTRGQVTISEDGPVLCSWLTEL